nr:MAG TPA: hypothetical protein [Caudoviricetes sp.]
MKTIVVGKTLGVIPSGFESQIGHQLITSLFSPFLIMYL